MLQERYFNSVCLLGPLFSKNIKKIQSKVLVTKAFLLKLQAEGFHLHWTRALSEVFSRRFCQFFQNSYCLWNVHKESNRLFSSLHQCYQEIKKGHYWITNLFEGGKSFKNLAGERKWGIDFSVSFLQGEQKSNLVEKKKQSNINVIFWLWWCIPHLIIIYQF